MGNTCHRNSEGYSDPTAYIAINNVEKKMKSEYLLRTKIDFTSF